MINNGGPLRLDDTADTIALFLDVLVGPAVSPTLVVADYAVIAFAQRYECRPWLDKLRLQIRSLLLDSGPRLAWPIFILACRLQDPVTGATAIRSLANTVFYIDMTQDEDEEYGWGRNGDFFDVNTWSVDRLEALGIDYLWAFSRAVRMGRVRQGMGVGTVQADRISAEFLRLLALPGE